MSLLGKVYRFFGLIGDTELSLIIHRIKQFRSLHRRTWAIRYAEEVKKGIVVPSAKDEVVRLEAEFHNTRLAKYHDGSMYAFPHPRQDELICIRLWAEDAKTNYNKFFNLYVYDVDVFLKACDAKGGLNMDDTHWLLKKAIRAAEARRANKSI